MRLSPLLKNEQHRAAIVAAALALREEQQKLRDTGRDRIEGIKVCERLVAAAAKQVTARPVTRTKPALTAAAGPADGKILAATRAKGIAKNVRAAGRER